MSDKEQYLERVAKHLYNNYHTQDEIAKLLAKVWTKSADANFEKGISVEKFRVRKVREHNESKFERWKKNRQSEITMWLTSKHDKKK